jgi:class 3 adenylate cyclase/DNA-binding beta-propeller fold protein YncE
MAEAPTGDGREGRAASVRTFLIADVRGYTSFSHEHGDEAASHLARRFADLVREAVPAQGGELLELRGDEALCAFNSAREALRAAVELQRRFRERVNGEPALPLGVGVGLDAGEAVATEGGYRGRALNVAARLCGLARPGEILASETVASLAGHQEGTSFAPRRPARLKGLAEPVRHVEVVPDLELPPLSLPRPSGLKPRDRFRGLARRWLLALLAAAFVLAAVLTILAVSLLRGEGSTVAPISVVPNSVAVIDPKTNRVVGDVRVGNGPGRIAVGVGKVWVLNGVAGTISLIDARRRALVKTFGVGATPADIAVGLGSVWVGERATSTVLQLDPDSAVVRKRIQAPPRGLRSQSPLEASDAGAIALTPNAVWFLSGGQTLSRLDPKTGQVRARIRLGGNSLTLAYIAAGEGAIWVSACCVGVTRIDPQSDSATDIPLTASGPIAAGLGGVWVAGTIEARNDPRYGAVWHIDADTKAVAQTIRCKGHALDLAIGEGSLWVACSDGAVLRVDPESGEVIRTIRVGGIPNGISVGEGAVWVAVD